MKKKISAILLACGLSVSMMSGMAFAAESETEASEAAALEEAATEAEAEESELAAESGDTAQTEAQVQSPRNVEGEGQYASLYEAIQQSVEATLAQLSSFTDDQVAEYIESTDAATAKLVASWDQVREDCGEFEGIDYYDVAEDGKTITFTESAKYAQAEETGSTVTVQVTVDMKAQTTDYNWNVKEPLGKAMAAAGENTVIGLFNVFLILFILLFVIYLFRFIPNGDKKKKELEAAQAAAPAPAPEAPAAEEEEDVSDEEEIAAVISAAVAAYESENGQVPADGFVVRSIRRRGRRNNWQNA